MSAHNTVVIGAGPAGLAVSALLKRAGVGHSVFEQAPAPGGLYARLHPDLKLLSPPRFNDLPLYPSRWRKPPVRMGEYREYLRDYAARQHLPLCCGQRITKIAAVPSGYRVTLDDGRRLDCARVIVATGMSRFPRALAVDHSAGPEVEWQHALDWRGVDYYRGKTVLIVGSGTTACELAGLLAGHAEVYLLVKKRLKTYPIDVLGINAVYLIRPLEKLPPRCHRWLCDGHWRDPAIDSGLSLAVRRGQVRVRYGPFALSTNTACFQDGTFVRVDVLINATGYRYDTAILPPGMARRPNDYLLCRDNQSVSHPGLFFIGYPCAHGIDSKFLRGIRRDAYRIAGQVA